MRKATVFKIGLVVCIKTIFITDGFAQKYGQNQIEENFIFAPILQQRITADCTPISPGSNCNYISNNNFTPTTPYNQYDPFSPGNVAPWLNTHGTPTLYDPFITWLTPPPPATGFAFLAADGMPSGYPDKGEGIAQKIPQLVPGNKYVLSFFRRFTWAYPWTGNMDQLNVVLMNCSDYQQFIPLTDFSPSVPTNSQTVYCETNITNQYWEKVVVKFTATNSYNMIWLFPRMTTHNKWGAIDIAYPELIDVTNFSAGTFTQTSSGCSSTVAIGPSQPNCSVDGAVFNWYNPLGQLVASSATSQQVNINPTTDFGTWTLKMEFPTAANTNSTCGQNWQIQSTINVTQPTVNPLSVLNPTCQFYNYANTNLVTQNLAECDYVNICNGNEVLYIDATSNQSSGNVWSYNVTYLNSTTGISGFTNLIDPQNVSGSTLSLNNNLNGFFVISPSMYAVIEIKLTNSATGTSKSFYIRVIPRNGAGNSICYSISNVGYKIIMGGFDSPDYTYQWSFPVGFNVINLNVRNAVYNEGTYTGSYPASAILLSTNVYGCGTQTNIIPLVFNPLISCNAKMSNPSETKEGIELVSKTTTMQKESNNFNSKMIVFPNPAQNFISFTTSKPIKEAIIRNASGILVKKIVINRASNLIDIALLNKGVYFVSTLDVEGVVTVFKFVKQ
jgi:hypothetical protein